MRAVAISLAVVVLVVAGCLETEEKRREVLSQPATATVRAPDLWQAYQENEVAADQRFKDKVVIVTGVVENIGKDIMDTPYVTLRTQDFGSAGYWAQVQCMFADTNIDTLGRLQSGQRVKIKGSVDGYLVNVILHGCTIVN